MGAIEQYFGGILAGEIVACRKMHQVAKKIIDAYEHPGLYHFDQAVADKHVGFIERYCKLPSGRLGVPLKLELFQKAILETVFGFVDDQLLRQFQEVLWIEGRKNGKSTTLAAVELDVAANDGEGSPQVFNVATKREQADIGWAAAYKMVRQSPELREWIRKDIHGLSLPFNFGFIRALASNTRSLDGLDVHCGVIDELSAIQNRDIYDLVKQGMAARAQPLLFTISTNGFVRECIFDDQYAYATAWLNDQLTEPNDRFVAFIYELDDRDEWDKEKCWIKANPGLGTIKSLGFLRGNVSKAKNDPAFKPTVMVKDFNLIENTATAWLTYPEILAVEPDPKRPGEVRPAAFDFDAMGFRYGIGGFDAADSIDLNAAVAFCQRRHEDGEIDPRIYVRSMYWLPEAVLEEAAGSGSRRERDNVPYLLWEQRGLLRTYPGNKVSKSVFLDWYRELRDEHDLYVMAIGYDPWHIADSDLADFEAEFGKECMIKVRQGVATMSQPLKEMRADLRANRIVHNSNPIDMWCMSNASVKTDINGNIQLVKAGDPRKRIDGLVAYACGYIALQARRDDYLSLI
jgi:phage terminase large subunit-like protein